MLVVIKLTLESIVADAPDNFVIQDALARCYEIIQEHQKIMCSVSGGADSDVMVDMMVRCGGKNKTDFVFFDTGLEYMATFQQLDGLEEKYKINIERVKAIRPIPVSVKQYGVPFWSKFVSEMIDRLQLHSFRFEDESFDALYQRYPRCKSALLWWCNEHRSDSLNIRRAPYLKEYIVKYPPTFRIASKCCTYAKKNVSKKYVKAGAYDLVCTGIRRAEGGVRSIVYKNCFSETANGVGAFRPVFWLSDNDKDEYCDHYGVTHSRCYTEYGLERTGCFGCPFGKKFEDELQSIEQFEPKLLLAANNIFGESYEYTRRYLAFREYMKREMKIHRT